MMIEQPTVLKDGTTTLDPRLDRLKEFDEASRGYQVRTLLDDASALKKLVRRHRLAKPGPTLDQGREGACVGFSCSHAIGARPFRRPVDNESARQRYFLAQQLDYWPGGEYPGASPRYSGSSVLGGMKALHQQGEITSYRWVGAGSQSPVDDAVDALRYVGQVVFGTYWFRSMFNPRPDGIMEVDTTGGEAAAVGGHAYTGVDALNLKLPGTAKRRLYVVVQNSWGTDWGTSFKKQGGFFYVLPEDLEKLLALDGEGAVPLKG